MASGEEKFQPNLSENLARNYIKGLDPICSLGCARVHGDYVLLRGITQKEMEDAKDSEILLGTAESLDDLRQCLVFEIVGKGPEVPEGIKVGDHCRPMATAMDPMHPRWKTRYARVRADYIPLTWDPTEFEIRAALAEDEAREAKKKAISEWEAK